jgi:hypothetical protein
MSIGLAHLNCRELVELVTAYLEDDLSSGERAHRQVARG